MIKYVILGTCKCVVSFLIRNLKTNHAFIRNGRAMVLGNFNAVASMVGQRPAILAVGAGWGCLNICFSCPSPPLL